MKISVLINTRNHGGFLRECVESVLAQNRPADELIVCDDGSTDGSAALLAGYGDRVTALRREHDPVCPARESQARSIATAFRHSTGDVILLLDGDDTFAPDRVARYAEAFARSPQPVLVQSPLHLIDVAGRVLPPPRESRRQSPEPLRLARRTQDLDFFYPTSALAFSRSFLLPRLPLSFADGVPLWSDVRLALAALLAGPVVTLPEALGGWRRLSHSDSLVAARDRFYLARLTWWRAQVFNAQAAAVGQPPVSVWRNASFYLRVAQALLPWALVRRTARLG